MNRILLVLLVIMVLAGGGWYVLSNQSASTAQTVTQTPATTTTQTTTPTDTTVAATTTAVAPAPAPIIGSNLALGTDISKGLGTYLIGYTGMTVYVNADDTGTTSTCNGSCAQTWIPYTVSPVDNINQLQAGVKGKVGTITRTDGTLQLTYNGHPLYFFSGDATGSDTKGNGLDGIWSIVKA